MIKGGLGLLEDVGSVAIALTGPRTSPGEKALRMEICRGCQAEDPVTGERLFRVIKGKPYCGKPRMWKPFRTAGQGCGCELTFKAGFELAHCPLEFW